MAIWWQLGEKVLQARRGIGIWAVFSRSASLVGAWGRALRRRQPFMADMSLSSCLPRHGIRQGPSLPAFSQAPCPPEAAAVAPAEGEVKSPFSSSSSEVASLSAPAGGYGWRWSTTIRLEKPCSAPRLEVGQ